MQDNVQDANHRATPATSLHRSSLDSWNCLHLDSP
jgi:hypothetical protein